MGRRESKREGGERVGGGGWLGIKLDNKVRWV